MTAEKS